MPSRSLAGRTLPDDKPVGGTDSGDCVEVSLAQDALVRDSENASGDVLAFSVPAWRDPIGWLGSR
jgi:hypothetical protein